MPSAGGLSTALFLGSPRRAPLETLGRRPGATCTILRQVDHIAGRGNTGPLHAIRTRHAHDLGHQTRWRIPFARSFASRQANQRRLAPGCVVYRVRDPSRFGHPVSRDPPAFAGVLGVLHKPGAHKRARIGEQLFFSPGLSTPVRGCRARPGCGAPAPARTPVPRA